jgi:hypothetical protein
MNDNGAEEFAKDNLHELRQQGNLFDNIELKEISGKIRPQYEV